MKLSVIIPFYNVESYLPECINSVINQTFQDYEVICVNDGSKDNSGLILRKLARKCKKLRIINQKNKGQSQARNIGINAAKGDYILFDDSDDYLADEHCLQHINDSLKDNMDILFFGFLLKGSEEREILPEEEKCTKQYKLFNDNYFHIWNKCFRRNFLLDNKIRFTPDRCFEDYLFSLVSIMLSKSEGLLKRIIYVYREKRPGSLTNSITLRKAADIVRNIADMIELTYTIPEENRIHWVKKTYNRLKFYIPDIAGFYRNYCLSDINKDTGESDNLRGSD